MSSANIAAVRQEKAEAEKPPKIPKKKGRPRKLVEFAPREMTSSQSLPQPPTFHPNSLGEGTSSGTSVSDFISDKEIPSTLIRIFK